MPMISLIAPYSLIIFAAGMWFLILSLTNSLYFKKTRKWLMPEKKPKITVMIPARNEEHRIIPTLEAVLQQDYPDFEVIVLDDHSTDGTWRILKSFEEKHSNLNVMKGRELPPGWKGKTYAMSVMSEKAEGELLVFIDADMVPEKSFLHWTAFQIENNNADFISGYARHSAGSVKEYIFFPLMYLMNMAYLPFWLFSKTKSVFFSHAIGQLMIFKRGVYKKIGGFAAVKDKIVEDVQMARYIKASGYNHIFVDAQDVLSGRMYDSWEHTVTGLKRSVYDYFNRSNVLLFFTTAMIFLFLVMPAVLLPYFIYTGSPYALPVFWGNVGIFFGWMITMYDRGMPWYVPFFYPLQFLFVDLIAWKSLADDVSGKGYVWKGRQVR